MSGAEVAGLRVLQGGRHERHGGNLMLLDETPGQEALLKVYRRRGSYGREASKRFSYRVIERKRGVTAAERCALERRHLALWRAEGFDVPALLDRPLPPGFSAETAQWLEYCPGTLLFWVVIDEAIPVETRSRQVARFAASLAERQGRALARNERGLVMKHASTKHVLVHGDRQVSFDLEGAYAPSFPILDALADELGANVRSLLLAFPAGDREVLGASFFEGYGRKDQLAAIADFGLRKGGISRAVRRVADRYRRKLSEYDALCWVEEMLGA